jgi:hypothetical protein
LNLARHVGKNAPLRPLPFAADAGKQFTHETCHEA